METIFYVVMFSSALITLILGVLVKYYRAYWLIAGYNTMSQEKREKVDVVGLSKLSGNLCFAIAAVLIIATIMFMFDKEAWGGITLALIVPISIYALIKAQKFDGNTKNPDGTTNRKTKLTVGGISGFLVLTMVGVGVLLYYSYQPSRYFMTDQYLEIKGLYGEQIHFQDISHISLERSLPSITFKNNGSSVGTIKKGHFRLDGIGNAKLFVDTSKPPFIYIERNGQLVILNCQEEKETEQLYQSLENRWGKSAG